MPSADGVNISKFQSLLYGGINKKNRHMREGKHPVLLAKFYSSNEATSIHENMRKYYRALWNDSIKFMEILNNFYNKLYSCQDKFN